MALGDILAGLASAHHEREQTDAAFARHERERKSTLFADLAQNPNYAPEQQEYFLKAAIAHLTDPKEAKKYDIKNDMIQLPVELMRAQKPQQRDVDAEMKPGEAAGPAPLRFRPPSGGRAPSGEFGDLGEPAMPGGLIAPPAAKLLPGSLTQSELLQPPQAPPGLMTPVGRPIDPEVLAYRKRVAAQDAEDIKEKSRVANDERDAAKAAKLAEEKAAADIAKQREAIASREKIAGMTDKQKRDLAVSKGATPHKIMEGNEGGRAFALMGYNHPETGEFITYKEDAGEKKAGSESDRDKDVAAWLESAESEGYEKSRTGFTKWKMVQDVIEAQKKAASRLSAGGSLTGPALDMLATQFAQTGALPAMGMGNAASADRRKIYDRAAELFPKLDVASNKAGFTANQQSLTQLTKGRDAVQAFEGTALKNLDIFLEQAKKVVDSGSPWINTPLRSVSTSGLGSADLAAFNAARQVAINEIAKVTSNPNLTGVLSDSARKEVEAFIPANATMAQVYAVSDVLKRDMKNRINELDEQIGEIKSRIKPAGQAGSKDAEKPADFRFNPATGKLEPVK